MQSLVEIVIDPERCPNCAAQFSEYEYLQTKDGEYVEDYPDENDDFIDATRYAMNRVWRIRGK
jgi:phage terminase large subunit